MSRNYWLHRISHEARVSYPLLDAGFLSIGFSAVSSDSCVENAQKGDYESFKKLLLDTWNYLPRNRGSLWNFLNKMKTGDFVVVPSWGTFSVYEIVGAAPIAAKSVVDELPNKDWSGKPVSWKSDEDDSSSEIPDIGFLWKVKTVEKGISRNLFANARLTARMKARQINLDIGDLSSDVMESLDAFRQNKPIDLKAAIIEQAAESWKNSIKENLNPDKLEKLVKWYLQRIGADLTEIPAKNSAGKVGDVDVTACFEKIRTCIDVQVKFHDGTTSDWSVDQISDFEESKNESNEYNRIPWVISTADSFTKAAELKARECNVRLIGINEFVRMLMDVGLDKMENFDAV